jgi:hypothetical protein
VYHLKMRPRELWFWLGAAFITAGSVLTAVAVAYYTKETNYSLSTGPQMASAYASFVLAFMCFLAAIVGWRPWLRWQRFPNLIIRVEGAGNEEGKIRPLNFPEASVRLLTYKVHITNAEVDRNVSITVPYLAARAKPESSWYEHLFTAPFWTVSYAHPMNVLEFPLNLTAQQSGGGMLIFEINFQAENLANPFDGRIEIHDAISGKMACFPAGLGTYRRRQGLRPTTSAERVRKLKTAEAWYGVMGPPDS